MTVKYECGKCGKRYVEWGAEKLGFRCHDCPDQELVRVGGPSKKPARAHALRRKPVKHLAPEVKQKSRSPKDPPDVVHNAVEKSTSEESTKVLGDKDVAKAPSSD